MHLTGRRIVLGVTGSIAAYKSVILLRLLVQAGAEVRVVLTPGSLNFVAPTTFQALSRYPVRCDLWDSSAEAAMSHIELAKWADTLLIAPATAHCIAKLAHGFADDLLCTLYLATTAKVVLAPAMNQVMYAHPTTQRNITMLREHGVQLVGPACGFQACGDTEQGRMSDPTDIVSSLSLPRDLSGVRIVITAGPTRERIDPVRFISNYSSGKMGYALARRAVARGAIVTLVSGPTALSPPNGCEVRWVESALEMHEVAIKAARLCDVFIGVAAVADYRCKSIRDTKIKKESHSTLDLEWVSNPDIVAEVCALSNKPFVVAFAAETHDVLDNAVRKKRRKGCDLLVANRVGCGLVFNEDKADVILLGSGDAVEINNQSKHQIADEILRYVVENPVPDCIE